MIEVDDVEVDELPEKPKHTSDEEEILHVNVGDSVIEINNVRLFSFDEVDLAKCTNCVSLSLRKNLLHELTPFPEHLEKQLTELDLFDNKIRVIGSFFVGFTVLTKLDLSYNQIKKIGGLESLGPTLEELYLVENKIKEVEGLESLVNLKLLELGGNRIRTLGTPFDSLSNLEQLWLGKNKIVDLGKAFNKLHKLKRLSLQANRIESLSSDVFPPSANPQLAELYLSENGLTSIQHIEHLSALTLVDFSFNPIETIDDNVLNAQTMPTLEEFWLTDGKISSWLEVDKLQQFANSLTTVYLERNPIEQDKRYRDKVFLALPFLSQIDSWPIVNKGNLEADRAIHRR